MHSDEITQLFTSIKDKQTLCVGLGNYQRGNDAVGLYIIEKLQKKCKKKSLHF